MVKVSLINSVSFSVSISLGSMLACREFRPAFFQSFAFQILEEELCELIQSSLSAPRRLLSFGIVQKPARCPIMQELRIDQSISRILALVLLASVLNQNIFQSSMVLRHDTVALRCRYSLNSATVRNGAVVKFAIS